MRSGGHNFYFSENPLTKFSAAVCLCLVWRHEDRPCKTWKSLISTFNQKLCPAIGGERAGTPAALSVYVVKSMCAIFAAVTAYGRAFYVSAVWAAMTWKWSFLLFFYARSYRRFYEHRTGICADVGYQKL